MNHWTECIDIWQVTYSGQGYSNLVQMKPWGHKWPCPKKP